MSASPLADALTASRGRPVAPEDINRATCVGLELKEMLCSWSEQVGDAWQTRSQYADLSDWTKITLLGAPSDLSSADAQWLVESRHQLNEMTARAIDEASEICGGGHVQMSVEGDQADHGFQSSDYRCADKPKPPSAF